MTSLSTAFTGDLIALDDSRSCKGNADALLRQEIAERYNRTRDNGGTTLSFVAWKQVFRSKRQASTP